MKARRIGVAAALLALALVASAFAALHYYPVRPLHGHPGRLPDATVEERSLAPVLRDHVVAIASEPHNTDHPVALESAARYIELQIEKLGYRVERQEYVADGQKVRNIHTTLGQSGIGQSGIGIETFVIGAHYDSWRYAPGANDNGTGTAALLELARLPKTHRPKRHVIRLVFFVNEEPPHFLQDTMGSAHFARWLAGREKVRAMISLETLGSYSDAPGTQSFPPPLGLIYASRGNFVAFVGTTRARAFVHEVLGAFRRNAAFPSIGGVGPDFVPGIVWSDHASFDEHGIPALMITDTAPFRYAHYHTRSDTADKLDFERLARVTKGVERMLREIAD